MLLSTVTSTTQKNCAVAAPCMYEGQVFHKRFHPKLHSLRYSVFAFWLDPLRLTQLSRNNRWVSHNRFNLFSIYDRDFAGGNLAGVHNYLIEQLEPLGDISELAHIRLLCYPRMFGYAFNPICVYYCYTEPGDLMAVVYEVNNTFGESTTYPFLVVSGSASTETIDERGQTVCPEPTTANSVTIHGCAKDMHVSPFTPMDMHYQFKLHVPDTRISVGIRLYDSKGTMLTASFSGKRLNISDGRLLRNVFYYPFMTFKVTAGIHWEALKLWIKKIPWFPHTTQKKTTGT